MYKSKTYTAYHYYADDSNGFVNDCLGLSELLVKSTKKSSTRAELLAPGTGKGSGYLFGNTYKKNNEIALDSNWYENEATNPNIGEAYAIIPTVMPGKSIDGSDEYPYHAAAVIAKDGTDNITLEAFAGSGQSRPDFHMYDTQPYSSRSNKRSKTFHEVYMDALTYERIENPSGGGRKRKAPVIREFTPTTGVLRARTD